MFDEYLAKALPAQIQEYHDRLYHHFHGCTQLVSIPRDKQVSDILAGQFSKDPTALDNWYCAKKLEQEYVDRLEQRQQHQHQHHNDDAISDDDDFNIEGGDSLQPTPNHNTTAAVATPPAYNSDRNYSFQYKKMYEYDNVVDSFDHHFASHHHSSSTTSTPNSSYSFKQKYYRQYQQQQQQNQHVFGSSSLDTNFKLDVPLSGLMLDHHRADEFATILLPNGTQHKLYCRLPFEHLRFVQHATQAQWEYDHYHTRFNNSNNKNQTSLLLLDDWGNWCCSGKFATNQQLHMEYCVRWGASNKFFVINNNSHSNNDNINNQQQEQQYDYYHDDEEEEDGNQHQQQEQQSFANNNNSSSYCSQQQQTQNS